MKTITQTEYQALLGLSYMASEHNKTLKAIENAACRMLGDEPNSHTADYIYSDHITLDDLLKRLNVTVELGDPA